MTSARTTRILVRAGAAALLALLLAGVPAMLIHGIGWPLPAELPTWQQTTAVLTRPPDARLLLNTVAVLTWLLWAMFTTSLAGEAVAVARHGLHHRKGHTRPGPLPHLTLVLFTALATGTLPAAAAGHAPPLGSTLDQLTPTTTIEAPTTGAEVPPAAVVAMETQPERAGSADGPRRMALWDDPPATLADPDLAGTVVVRIAEQRHVVEVVKGDTLWDLADAWLQDPQRWPEIYQLNRDHYELAGGHHIEPTWQLVLPEDATPPQNTPPQQPPRGEPPPDPAHTPPAPPSTTTPPAQPAQPAHPAHPAPPQQSTPADPRPAGAPTPHASPTAAPDPDGVIIPPPSPPAAAPASPPSAAPATPPVTVTPGPSPPPAPPPQASSTPGAEADLDEPVGDPDGIGLPDGSWLPWTVATAVAAAMAVVWLQRRRRYQPRRLDSHRHPSGGPAPGSAPAVVTRIRRALRTRTRTPEPEPAPGYSTADDQPPDPEPQPPAPMPQPVLDPLAAGGLGLVGPGAQPAARGALLAALAAGAPTDPDTQTEVVIPADTMVTLLGADAVALGTWRRLHVTPDLDTALAVLETRLLSAARVLDEYEVPDVATLHRAAPAEVPLPPLLLLAPTPPAGSRMRTQVLLGLGRPVQLSALLLGGWDGASVHVEADGTCQPGPDSNYDGRDRAGLPERVPPRMAVLHTAAAYDLLRTLREAHTGQPDPAAPERDPHPRPDQEEPSVAPPHAHHHGHGHGHDEAPGAPADADGTHPSGGDTAAAPHPAPAGHPGAGGAPRAVVRVLGEPAIHNSTAAGRPLRTAAVELMVYLAAHPDGADPETIQENLWPDSRRRLAVTKLHTAASNLRHTLAAAAGATPGQAEHYVRKERGRYRLDTTEVDLWRLHTACNQARAADQRQQRLHALREACAAYQGELAAGCDYEWITPHREAARSLALDAHTTLAAAVAADYPAEAARLLSAAVDIDPMNEVVYRQAMHAWHRLGQTDTIRTLLRRLAQRLDSIGAEPAEETITLAQQLRHDLEQPPRRPQ